MSVAAQVIEMRESGDAAKDRMLAHIRPWVVKSNIRAIGHDVLVAMYNRAGQQTAGGVFIPDTNREDEFQGKVGLVVDLGPMASGSEFEDWFGSKPPQVGDWVGLNIRDGMSFLLGGMTFRLVEWKYIRFMVDVPDKAM